MIGMLGSWKKGEEDRPAFAKVIAWQVGIESACVRLIDSENCLIIERLKPGNRARLGRALKGCGAGPGSGKNNGT